MEIWLAVPGYEGVYEVSNFGRVRSLLRLVNSRWGKVMRKGVTLRPGLVMPGGYRQVALQRDGVTTPRYVHDLVLEAFVGPAPAGHECRHLDGDSENNRLDNLAWGTRLENAQDKMRHGTVRRGETHGSTKLPDSVVVEIRRRLSLGEKQAYIAAVCGTSQGHVSRINRGVLRKTA